MRPMDVCVVGRQFGTPLTLKCVCPEAYPYCPEVKVGVRYTDESLIVRFDVSEEHVRALETTDNNPVCVDSCVEVFVMMSDGVNYVNFECNPLGTLLAARRPTRREKTPLCADELSAVVRRGRYAGHAPFERRAHEAPGAGEWWLELEIPFRLLGYEVVPRSLRLNMYKCGDCGDIRHYLSLFPVECEKPDFHRPEFFGILELD